MSNILNNINFDKIQKTIETGQKDKLFLKKPVRLEGEWNFDVQKDINSRQNWHMRMESR